MDLGQRLAFPTHDNEMGRLIRSHDWCDTSLGPLYNWSSTLRTLVNVILSAKQSMSIVWGAERVLIYNDAYTRLLGDKHPAALGKPCLQVWAEIRERIEPLIEQVFAGEGVFMLDIPMTVNRSGAPEEVSFGFSHTPVMDDNGQVIGLFSNSMETTTRVNTERERAADLARLWNVSPDLLVLVDFNGIFRRTNPAWTTLLGYGPNEIVGTSMHDVIHPDDIAASTKALEHSIVGPLPWFENRCRHRDGSYRRIAWTAALSNDLVFALGKDVTVEKAAGEALEHSQAILRSLFETSFQMQALLSVEGVLLEANATALAAIGVGLNDVTGKPYWEMPWFKNTTGISEVVRNAVQAAAAGHSTHTSFTLNIEGEVRSYDFFMRPLFDACGAVAGIVSESVDNTDKVRVEDALRQSQKMEAVGQLTGGIAHDFNNILAGISGSLELTQTRLGQGRLSDAERLVGVAQHAATRAAALTHRLLAFSRRQTLEPKPTKVNALVEGMEDLIRRTVGPAIDIAPKLYPDPWTTLVDQSQLENALLNLCLNARDAMPKGGKLAIETYNKSLDSIQGRERGLPPGDYVVLRVEDDGSGMSQEVMDRAFDPFFTTKPIGMGTGLGLSMIYGFAKQSGGQVRLQSRTGFGTRVCIYLPRHHAMAHSDAEDVQAVSASHAGRGQCVLVVDDEEPIRMFLSEMLSDLGYIVLEAQDGASGLRVMESNVRIDLLISDVGLPNGMNGRQMAEAGRMSRPGLKVLFITGYAESAVIRDGDLEHGMHVITKPFNLESITTRVRDLINEPEMSRAG